MVARIIAVVSRQLESKKLDVLVSVDRIIWLGRAGKRRMDQRDTSGMESSRVS